MQTNAEFRHFPPFTWKRAKKIVRKTSIFRKYAMDFASARCGAARHDGKAENFSLRLFSIRERERHNVAYFDGHRGFDTPCKIFVGCRRGEADHRKSGFIVARDDVWRREKTPLKCHVTRRSGSNLTRAHASHHPRVYQIRKKAALGLQWNTIAHCFLPYAASSHFLARRCARIMLRAAVRWIFLITIACASRFCSLSRSH